MTKLFTGWMAAAKASFKAFRSHVLISLMASLVTMPVLSQTVNETITLADFTLSPLPYTKVTLTPLTPFADYQGTTLSAQPRSLITDSNATCVFSNVVSGYIYRLQIFGPYVTTTVSNGIPAGTTGNVNFATYIGTQVGQYFAYYYLTNGVTTNGALAGQFYQYPYGWKTITNQSSGGGTPILAGTNVVIASVGGSNQINVPTNAFDYAGAAQAATNAFKPLPPVATNGSVFLFIGDSLTAGTSGIGSPGNPGRTYAMYLTNLFYTNNAVIWSNVATAGERAEEVYTNYSNSYNGFPSIHSIIVASQPTNVIAFVWMGINNEGNNNFPAIATNLSGIYTNLKADGVGAVVALTLTDNGLNNGGGEVTRNLANTYIKTNRIADYVVDASSRFPLGWMNATNTWAYIADGTHLTTNSQMRLAQAVYGELQKPTHSYFYPESSDLVASSLKIFPSYSYAGLVDETYHGLPLAGYVQGGPAYWFFGANNFAAESAFGNNNGLMQFYNMRQGGGIAYTSGMFGSSNLVMSYDETQFNIYPNITSSNTFTSTNVFEGKGDIIRMVATNNSDAIFSLESPSAQVGQLIVHPGANAVELDGPNGGIDIFTLITRMTSYLDGNGFDATNFANLKAVNLSLSGNVTSNLTSLGGTNTITDTTVGASLLAMTSTLNSSSNALQSSPSGFSTGSAFGVGALSSTGVASSGKVTASNGITNTTTTAGPTDIVETNTTTGDFVRLTSLGNVRASQTNFANWGKVTNNITASNLTLLGPTTTTPTAMADFDSTGSISSNTFFSIPLTNWGTNGILEGSVVVRSNGVIASVPFPVPGGGSAPTAGTNINVVGSIVSVGIGVLTNLDANPREFVSSLQVGSFTNRGLDYMTNSAFQSIWTNSTTSITISSNGIQIVDVTYGSFGLTNGFFYGIGSNLTAINSTNLIGIVPAVHLGTGTMTSGNVLLGNNTFGNSINGSWSVSGNLQTTSANGSLTVSNGTGTTQISQLYSNSYASATISSNGLTYKNTNGISMSFSSGVLIAPTNNSLMNVSNYVSTVAGTGWTNSTSRRGMFYVHFGWSTTVGNGAGATLYITNADGLVATHPWAVGGLTGLSESGTNWLCGKIGSNSMINLIVPTGTVTITSNNIDWE